MLINETDFETLVICSFRYALGRMTYVVGEVCDLIIFNQDKLSQEVKDLIIKEIKTAIYYNKAGMPCDVEIWQNLLDTLIDDRECLNENSRRTG